MTMKEIKEKTKKLEKAFRKFIKKIYDVDMEVVFADEFAYYHDDEKIEITLGVPASNGFMEDLKMRYNVEVEPENQGIFYLLHELGHHFTWDKLEQEVHDHCDIMKKELERVMNATYTDDTFKHFYYGCIDEELATQWACAEYFKIMQYHTKEVEKLAKAVDKFFVECEVTD